MFNHVRPAKPVANARPAAGPDDHGAARKRRPSLFALASGAIDAHINHVDYFDTAGGDELRRLFRQYRATRRAARPPGTAPREGRRQKAA